MTAPALVRYRTPILLALAIYIVLDALAALSMVALGRWVVAAILLLGLGLCLVAYTVVKDYRP